MTTATNKPEQGTPQKNICVLLNPREVPNAQRTIVVLGVARGGTSMAAGILRALGISMGRRLGLNHEDPLFLVDEPDKLKRRIRVRNKEDDVWGFKVPKASLLLDFYEQELRNPCYVIVYRNSLAIVDSWMQRGAGNAAGVLERIAMHHGAVLALLRKTGAPVLMVNYERAVQDEGSKAKVVEELARFAGVDLTDALRERAIGMMTGDGKGYVNLPEHYFRVEPRRKPARRAATALTETTQDGLRDAGGWVSHETPRPQLFFARQDGANLPRAFWLELDLESEGLDLSTKPLRIFFNFTGEYFPGHCARPPVRPGRNTYWVETSGNARDFAFGPLEVPSRLKIAARLFQAQPDDRPVTTEAPQISAARHGGKAPGLLRRAARKVLRGGS